MESLILVVAGALFGVLFFLNALLQSIRGRLEVGFVATLFAFIAVVAPLVGVALNALASEPNQLVTLGGLAVSGGFGVLSLLVLLIDLPRQKHQFIKSRGLMGIGSSLLLALGVFFAPVLASDIFPQPDVEPISISIILTNQAEPTTNPNITPLPPTQTPTPTHTFTPTLTRTPRPTFTPSETREQFASRTPTFTPTVPNPCLIQIEYNLNVRSGPSYDDDVLTTIPFGTNVSSVGHDGEQEWWFVTYEGVTGWVNQEFITLSFACEELPAYNP